VVRWIQGIPIVCEYLTFPRIIANPVGLRQDRTMQGIARVGTAISPEITRSLVQFFILTRNSQVFYFLGKVEVCFLSKKDLLSIL